MASELDSRINGEDSLLREAASQRRGLQTYDRYQEFTPNYMFECNSVDEVRTAIKLASSSQRRVRPLGLGFSWAEHVLAPDICVSLSGLNRIHAVDTDRKTISVDAGARLGDVSYALAQRGLSLPSLPFFPEMTVGGAMATGTHGTNHRYGTVSDFVRSMDLVLSSGEIKRLGPHSPQHELRAARVAIGMLGVIVRLELQAIDMPWVRLSTLEMDLNAFSRDRDAIMARFEHVWGHWTLGTQRLTLKCLETDKAPRPGFHRFVDYRNGCWEPVPRLKALCAPGWRRIRRVLHRKNAAAATMQKPEFEIGSATDVRISMQYGVALEEIETTIQSLLGSRFASQNAGRTLELKFLRGTDLTFLGPNSARDSVLFNIWWRVPRDVGKAILDPFEDIMLNLRGRPHWGKIHRISDTGYLKAAFPNWSQFDAVRKLFDPSDMFKAFG